jgi:phosphatidylserine/phosphatidylglycerophosphate/cardiolipin synthase-like enzyme
MPVSKYASLIAAVSSFVENIPNTEIERVVSKLLSTDGNKMKGHLVSLSSTARTEPQYKALDDAWNTTPIVPDALALALDAAVRTANAMQSKREVAIVWTGPATEVVPLRRTEQVLCEIIDAAKETLLIVSFVAYRADDVLAAIRRALHRKVRVMMVLETEKESGGKVSFDLASKYKTDFPGLEMYIWPSDKRETDEGGHHGAIHAKCAVVDRRLAFITSANLTEFALELNMELGILMRDDSISTNLQDHFETLISRGILKKL